MADWAVDVNFESGEQALEVSCSLLCELLEELGRDVPDELERRAHQAMRVLESFPLPAAAFGGVAGASPLVNAGWRTMFRKAEVLPARLAIALESVRRTQRPHHLRELAVELPSYKGYFTVTIMPLRGTEGTSGALVVCVESTDAVVARQLGVDAQALIWGGSITAPPYYYNRRWQAVIGSAWDESIHHADAARAIAADLETERRRESMEIEVRLLGEDGAYKWYRVRFTTQGGRAFGSAVDIHASRRHEAERNELLDEARAARSEAEHATQLKDEFLAAVSHELRAPLTTMLLWEKVLRENCPDDESRARALDAIHQSVVTQARLVSDLLDVSRGISGKLYLDIRPLDIERIVTEAFEAVRPLAQAKEIDLIGKFAPFVGGIHGDATRLRQVLDNLLSNAIKFTPREGIVSVSLRRRGRSVAVDIEDTGRGIAPDLLTKIFEPFRQAEDALSRREGGLGLGLTIAKHLVDLHRGTLIATSRGLGKGARFTLTLPSSGTPRAPSPPVGAPQVARLDGRRVLVIDDDPRVREALALLLARAGVLVDTADSGTMGRARIAAIMPDAVICDIAMPGEDGYSFVRRLRASGSKVPAIALTGYATQLDVERASEAGFDLHLPKPISFERLAECLGELLAARRERTV